jgi:hypothetical protein
MIAESQIREKLGHYLSKEWSLAQFEDWLVQGSWNMHKDSEEQAQKLASAIELRLAEHSSGHLNEKDLRAELQAFLNSPSASVSFGQAEMSSDAQNNAPSPRVFVVQESESRIFQPLSGIPPVEVSL